MQLKHYFCEQRLSCQVKYVIVFTTIAIIYKNFVQIYPELLSNGYVESSNSYQLMIRLGESVIKNFKTDYFI